MVDRQIVYSGAIPLDTDQLSQNKNTMIGLGMALQAILGTVTLFDGLACTPTGPASLQVLVGPGSVYAVENVDSTAYGSVGSDTTHQIVKQGINLGTLTLNCPAPGTTGQSINYLIQSAYQDTDTGSTVLPYYNSSNPAVAYNGPGNSGTSQNTVRQGQCLVAVKAGVAATTGSQTTPAPDAGYTGLWVVTVANAQTTITSGNISLDSGAPFITNKLTALAPLASPALTGVPTVPTASPGTNTTQAASTAFVENAAGIPGRTALFTSSGSWTAPAGITSILVSAAAGGGGGSGSNGTTNGGEGGGGGQAVISDLLTVVPGTVYTITIGAAGAAGASTTNGGNGGATSIGSLLTLSGGQGGAYIGTGSGFAGGSGGAAGGDNNLLFAGAGGSSVFGPGGQTRATAGSPGAGYGGGGSGGPVQSGPLATAGAAGSPGFVLISW